MSITSRGKRYSAVFAALIAIFPACLYGEGFYFEKRDISALTAPTVMDIAADDRGCIWAATPGGLVRYDGLDPVLLDRKVLSNLPSDDVISVEYSPSDTSLWIGTVAGLIHYNLINEESYQLDFLSEQGEGSGLEVLDLVLGRDERLFAATVSGTFAADNKGSMVAVGKVPEERNGNLNIVDLASDSSGTVWAAGGDGLWKWIEAESGFSRVYEGMGLSSVEIMDDAIWIGDRSGDILTLDDEGREINRYRVEGGISDFVQDENGYIWVATFNEGLFLINPVTGEISIGNIDPEHPYRLSSRRITSLFKGKDRRIWIGTGDAGLFSVDLDKGNFLAYTRRSGPGSLPAGPLHVIHEDSLGYIWVGSDIGGLARIDPLYDEINQYTRNDSDIFSINGDHVSAMLEDSSGRIWIGTDQGPVLYIPEVDGFEPPGAMMRGWPDFQGSHVLAMAEGDDGGIWMSLRDGSLYKLDTLERDFQYFHFTPATAATVLNVDRYGSLWAGSRTNLKIFNADGGLVKTWESVGLENGGIPGGGVTALYSDSLGRLWLGSSTGLVLYYGESLGFEPINLPGNELINVSGIQEDAFGRMWVSEGREIHVFDAEGAFLGSMGASVGFTPAGRISGMELGRDGTLLAGASGEVWAFNDLILPAGNKPPKVFLNGMKVLNKIRANGRQLEIEGDQDLFSNENMFSISFSAVNFQFPSELRYEHLLEGFLDEWVDGGKSEIVTYAKLPPGDYRFVVRAYRAGDMRPGPEASVGIHVEPVFWIGGWAIGLYILATAGLVAVFIKLREGRLLKSQVLELEEARAKVLDANKKLEFLTMNDSLTGLLNRRGFDQAISHALTTASRNDLMISLFMMDVDCFKLYNDNYGHVQGDEVLRNVGKALSAVFERSTDIIARYGGEEFAVVFIGENPNATVTLANDLLVGIDALNIRHEFSLATNKLTLSVGSATILADEDTSSESLINRSDQALYVAKDEGRNRVCYTGIIPALPDTMKNGTRALVYQAEKYV